MKYIYRYLVDLSPDEHQARKIFYGSMSILMLYLGYTIASTPPPPNMLFLQIALALWWLSLGVTMAFCLLTYRRAPT